MSDYAENISGKPAVLRIADALRLVRVFHDLSQTQLAERLGISNSFLSQIEGGKKNPTLDLLEKYAEVFHMPLSSLIFFVENTGDPSRSEKMRAAIALKALTMLQWIAAKEIDAAQRREEI